MAEKRLIDAKELESYLWVLFKYFGSLPCSEADKVTQRTIKRCIGEVKKMPTVDAVEVVRCKDCKYWIKADNGSWHMMGRTDGTCRMLAGQHCADMYMTEHDHYCSYGERKDNEVQG